MPKLIDYPRTSYPSAWEVAEVVDDTGGKCALETCARKLNRKVSGSFKAIVGSAVKFGLLTSKRELLTTTTLFKRIKHAYDKQEELLFHREAFLTPPLFTQICRKFRSRELPVAMLDVLLIREFDVEEINAQSVAKSFVEGARMVGLLDEYNVIADIDQLGARQTPRRELASPSPPSNTFRPAPTPLEPVPAEAPPADLNEPEPPHATAKKDEAAATITTANGLTLPGSRPAPAATSDAIAALFGLAPPGPTTSPATTPPQLPAPTRSPDLAPLTVAPLTRPSAQPAPVSQKLAPVLFRLQLSGPGITTDLDVTDADDLTLVRALLDKLERQLRRPG